MSIDFQEIKNGVVAVCSYTAEQVGYWGGKVISVLKSGVQTGLPYFQDKRIAVISLLVASLLSIEVGHWVNLAASRLFLKNYDQVTRDRVTFWTGLSIFSIGVACFAKGTNLPLPWYATGGIAIGSGLFRAQFASPTAS